MTTVAHKLSRRSMLLYGMGDWGFSMTSTILAICFPMFLSDVAHVNLRLAAAVVFVGRSWDWINDPLVGYLSDRTRSRWGRRRPFLLFGVAPFALCFAMLWWIPPFRHPTALAAYYGLAYLLFDAAATFVYMPYFALTPELSPDYDERTSLTTYRMFFSIAASVVAFVIPGMIIGSFRPENAGRVALMGMVFGVTSALPLLGTFFGTRERPEFQSQPRPSLRDSLRAVLRNRPFLFAVGIYLLTWLTVDLLLLILPFFLKYWLNQEAQQEIILGTVFVVAALALPLWMWACHRWSKRHAYVAGVGFLGMVMIVLTLMQPSTPLAAILALAALAGIGVAAAHVVPWSIIPDAVEWDELATGQRHEGAFYSLITLASKVAASVALPAAMLLLDWGGYEANAAVQGPRVLLTIRALAGAVPALLLIGGMVFAFLYPLSREQHLEVRLELAQRRAGAGAGAATGAEA